VVHDYWSEPLERLVRNGWDPLAVIKAAQNLSSMAQDLETLLARSRAAELQAKRLSETISISRRLARELIAMRKTLHFTPVEGRKVCFPQDFSEKQRTGQPFPIRADEDQT
jgi:hypothetical protein